MIFIVDEREAVVNGYAGSFDREGVPSLGLCSSDAGKWFETASDEDIMAIDAVLLGRCERRAELPGQIKNRSRAAVIALNEERSLDETLGLFAAGVDDVVRKPIHVREILARIAAIQKRHQIDKQSGMIGELRVFCDGRDPEIGEEPLRLPRRERRILEFLVANRGKRLTKERIFNHVYGLFDHHINENIIESHISKLRKRLRQKLGYDPIDSQRYLGYRLK